MIAALRDRSSVGRVRLASPPRGAREERDERGATVVEWALIAAIVVVAASIVAAVVLRIVDAQGAVPVDCTAQPTSVECSP
jgi:Flp pilus assembly pilin Flp